MRENFPTLPFSEGIVIFVEFPKFSSAIDPLAKTL